MAVDRCWINVGAVFGVFGIKGWVKVFSYTDPRENILNYSPWHLDWNGERTAFMVTEGRRHGKGIITHLQGIDTREEAGRLCGARISIAREQLLPLPANQYYWSDLVGLTVYTRSGRELGRVKSIIETGANDVLVLDGERERLIPFVLREVVEHIDLAAGTMRVDWNPDY
jgi:16S rRNA processing protein RimM